MKIVKNNVLLADFIKLKRVEGYSTGEYPYFFYPGYDQKDITSEENILDFAQTSYNLDFDTNFNSLMSIVTQIGKMEVDDMLLSVNIEITEGFCSCVILGTHIYCDGAEPIKVIWETCVKFVTWYNEKRGS